MTGENRRGSRLDAGACPDDPLLDVTDLVSGYDETEVLHGVSLCVAEGEIVSLVGRNGAGKTTTLRSILGSVEPTAGRVAFRGEDVTRLSPEETVRRNVAFVPEERRVFPGLTVRENLRVGRLGGGETAERRSIDEVLATFENLGEHPDRLAGALSGGEQQMLAIARALVGGADLLMLDEPTEGLAPYVVRRVEELVADLNDEGISVLLVEQNVQVALELADRHYVLDRGEIVYHGTSEQLREDEEVMDRHLGVTT
ncbi:MULTISPECIES: ABC transporter ATP-binding protein [Halorussus]|uniref:ABC transporter ATP-binding protein n=1 Tax=Halorussus TaxID=1070314 RepID=UPI0020A1BD30|nr:ABC transporter ATP-binding protein [Halorussus vallis]USZ77838.1 ABC transporter ATP-binding protein [Halorussus vallis]